MKHIFLFAFCMMIAGCASKPIKTLIVTGQNNHNWPVSHVVLHDILENSGMFSVDIAATPGKGGDMSAFNPDFSAYKLVVMDYNGDRWSPETDEAFLKYLKNGGGLVIYHAANNAFGDWPEFNRIIALGGWGGRNQQTGLYHYWENGNLIEDDAPGPGGSHGDQHAYLMTCRDTLHPITQGLPAEWLHNTDELYDRMRGPGNFASLLYTAYSDTTLHGSGRNEPLLFTVDYKPARIFHTMLGHVESSPETSPAMQCTGFQVTLLRGAEWAATGKVTQPVPADFPTAERTSVRLDFRAPK